MLETKTELADFKQHFAQTQLLCLLQQISATMQKFEGMFEDLDVNTQVMSKSTSIYLLLFIFNLDLETRSAYHLQSPVSLCYHSISLFKLYLCFC